MKKVKCSRCGLEREVPDDWKYRLCPKCIARKRKKRAEERKVRQKAREKAVSAEIQKDNLNFGLKHVREELMSWDEFHEEFPERTYAEYLQAKESERREWVDVPKIDLPEQFEAEDYPLYDDECIEFRRQVLLNERTFDNLCFWNSHQINCPSCNAWFVRHKPARRGFTGGDIWKKSEEEKPKPSDEDLTDQLHECLEEDYGRDY